MKPYCYRITHARIPTQVLCAGSLHAEDADAAIHHVIKRLKITVTDEYYDAGSMMAGAIFRTDFTMRDKPVNIAITPDARHYRSDKRVA